MRKLHRIVSREGHTMSWLGHPRLSSVHQPKTWMPACAGMTVAYAGMMVRWTGVTMHPSYLSH